MAIARSDVEYNNNARRNLTLFWKQFYPQWEIPTGFHVHHIKPKCTFEDRDDLRIHHPSNLIALHPDDHLTIHRCRGDKWIQEHFVMRVAGQKFPADVRLKMSKAHAGKKLSFEHKAKIGKAIKGKKHNAEAIANMQRAQVKSEETKEKLSMAHKGKIRSVEHSRNISKAKKGVPNPHVSKKFKGSTWKEINGKRVWTFKEDK